MSRWIKAERRLPKTDNMVLVIASGKPCENITLNRAIEMAFYSKEEGWILESWPEWEDAEITHWTPLPQLPEEVAGEM